MIQIRILGAETTELALKSFGLGVRERLREAVTSSAISLWRNVRRKKLSGQVLKNRTGTLRRHVNYKITETPSAINATVGVKLSYAAAHEYGFEGVVTVKQHLRTIKQAWGRPIAPTPVLVSSHSRHVHLPARSFLRSALAESEPSIRQSLQQAIAAAGPVRR